MRKMIVVAVREYQAAVRTKAFIVSLVLMPVMTLGSIAVQKFMRNKVDINDKRVVVVDYTGRLFSAIEQAATERNDKEIYRKDADDIMSRDWEGALRPSAPGVSASTGDGPARTQTRPRFVFEQVQPASDDPQKVAFDLSDQVRKKEIFGFLIVGPDVIVPGTDPVRASMAYHSNSPTYDDIQRWLSPTINKRIQRIRFEAKDIDAEFVDKAIQRIPIDNLTLVSMDQSGQIKKAEKTNELANIFIPLGMMMLMFMVVMIGASPLMQSVLEEKTNRIAEVLLGSVRPFELMMGKLIGMVGVSLTIVTIYLGGAYLVISWYGFVDLFPKHIIWWFVAYLCLAVLMYGSLFIAVGSAVSDMREAQSLMTPVMLLVVSPMFVWFNVVREPSSTLSTVLSLFPPATPMLMAIRQSVPPGIPTWQPALGIVLVLLTTVACIFAAGRIFRVGILMQGKGAKLGEMMRWVLRG